ncbi:hypothetical protein NDA16_000463 [Ustilago loliicola]|nr:hypothetical protein NDA16_000463 [Ustilago loliicola]
MAALKLEKDEADQRTAEVERRNKQRGEEKEKRRLAIQKQVEDGIKAIKLEKRDEVIADVQRAINRKWPGQGLKVAAFGSSVTGLVTESSDLDLVLLDPTRPYGVGTPSELCVHPNSFVRHSSGMPEWYSTHQVASAIKSLNKFRNVVSISGASVPIVKMIHKKYDIPSDININERFGLFNSQLICAYADLQPDLVLQMEGLLPNLQSPVLLNRLNVRPSYLYSRPKRPRRRVNGRHEPTQETTTPPQKYNVTFASSQLDREQYRKKAIEVSNSDASATIEDARASNMDRVLGKMLASFVRFYAHLDRRSQVISMVNGAPTQRKRGSQPRHVLFDSASEEETEVNGLQQESPIESQQIASRDAEGRAALRAEQADIWEGDELVVQDPFIIDRNTSRNIKAASIERWQGEMQRAMHLLGLDRLDKESKVELGKAPLVLDLCIPQTVLDDLEATVRQQAKQGTAAASNDPWRLEEEAAAQEKEIARLAAQELRREKKKKARRAKSHNARVLQEEAAMVEDMIDGIETGRRGQVA